MNIQFTCPYWGHEHLNIFDFFELLKKEKFNGVEINLPSDETFVNDFIDQLEQTKKEKPDFVFIAQQVSPLKKETPVQYLAQVKENLEFLVSLNPDFINSHTGKDHFDFDDNCRIIEAIMEISERSNIPIYHETHRGRFAFHSKTTMEYIKKFPDLKLVADLSHWCTVSESMLEDQPGVIEALLPNIAHIHARVGYEHSPQVNDPFAPEWEKHLNIFLQWWNEILEFHAENEADSFTITPEFGPVPYMPALPYSLKPTADQWEVNAAFKNLLKKEFFSLNARTVNGN